MNSLLILSLLVACPPRHPVVVETPRVSIESLPLRPLTVEVASVELWRPELRPPWRAPTEQESLTVAALVPELLRAAQTMEVQADAGARAAAVGMRLERWEVAGTQHLVLSEMPDQRRGAGAYLFSVAHPIRSVPWLLWEAPHPYYDQRTGDIAADLYFNPPTGSAPAAFFTSTMHRYTQPDGKRDKKAKNPADPCHNEDHLFNIATQAAAAVAPRATVIQLHGFAGGIDDDEGNRPPVDAQAVISAGRADAPSPLSSVVASELVRLFGAQMLLYPLQVQALGGTTNVELAGLQSLPDARFLHIEMASSFRDLLSQDPSRRDAFGAALYRIATDPAIP